MLFLMETKNKKERLVDLKLQLGYDNVFVVEPEGLSGGLALLWKREVVVDIKFADKNLIDVFLIWRGQKVFASFVWRTFSSR